MLNFFIFKKYNLTIVSHKIFLLPKKKSKHTFLRAPYKNKLAQLSIIRFEHSFIISYYVMCTNSLYENEMLKFLHTFNLDYSKTKHFKTKISLDKQLFANFLLKNYY